MSIKPSEYSRLSLKDRRRLLKEYADLTEEELNVIDPYGGLSKRCGYNFHSNSYCSQLENE